MTSEKNSGLKSSLELAMERLAAKDGPVRSLTSSQKQALAEIDQKTKARIAEMEILYEQKISQAQHTDKTAELKQELHSRILREREQAEDEKERVRKG